MDIVFLIFKIDHTTPFMYNQDRGMRLKSDPDPTWFLKSKNNHDRKME